MRGGPCKKVPNESEENYEEANKQKLLLMTATISYSKVVENNCAFNKYWLNFIDLLHLATPSLYKKMLQIDTQYCARCPIEH